MRLKAKTTAARSSSKAKPALIARIEELARPTRGDRYHDMLTVDDREFKEDATSYLRAALLLDRLGLDTTLYRKEIAAMKGVEQPPARVLEGRGRVRCSNR